MTRPTVILGIRRSDPSSGIDRQTRMYDPAEAQIREKVRMVVTDEANFGVLSCGERIAVALVLDRYDLLKCACGTMAEAVHRLGQEWAEAALRVQRSGWDQPF